MITAITNNRVQNKPAFKSGNLITTSNILKREILSNINQAEEAHWLTKIASMVNDFKYQANTPERSALDNFLHEDGTKVKINTFDSIVDSEIEGYRFIEITPGNQKNLEHPEKIIISSNKDQGDNATQMSFFDSIVELFMNKKSKK